MKHLPQKLLLLALGLGWALALTAQTDAHVRTTQFNQEKGLAIQGYDPVAYFTQNKALKGQPAITHTHAGVTYRFANEAHRKLFIATPEKYEPAYGGWCAYAMGANGEKVEIDPETFEIKNGHLYLFYHTFFTNTLASWQKDRENLRTKADASWQKLAH